MKAVISNVSKITNKNNLFSWNSIANYWRLYSYQEFRCASFKMHLTANNCSRITHKEFWAMEDPQLRSSQKTNWPNVDDNTVQRWPRACQTRIRQWASASICDWGHDPDSTAFAFSKEITKRYCWEREQLPVIGEFGQNGIFQTLHGQTGNVFVELVNGIAAADVVDVAENVQLKQEWKSNIE